MAEEDDWAEAEAELLEDDPTRASRSPALDEAVPQPVVASPDTTGRYRTLPGFEVSAEIRSGEREIGHREVYAGFKLAQIASGTHPDVAQKNADRLQAWCEENWHLIRVVLGR